MALTKVSRGLLTTSIVDNGNATAITIDSSENVGIGGAPSTQLFVKSAANAANVFAIESADAAQRLQFGVNTSNGGSYIFEQKAQALRFGTSDAERMRIDSSGKLIVNGTVPGYSGADITVGSPSEATAGLSILSSTTGYGYVLFGDVVGDATGGYSGQINYNHSLNRMGFVTNNTERLAIHGTGQIEATSSANDDYGFEIKNISSTNPYGLQIELANGTSNTTQALIVAASGGNNKFIVWTNGNAQNVNNSYTGLSDLKLKENIVDSGSQWDDLKAVRVRKYSLKDANLDAPNMLGVIAQELEEAGMSGLVDEHPDKDDENNDLGTVTKSVSYSILYMKAIKALQEAMERIETLEAKVQELENN